MSERTVSAALLLSLMAVSIFAGDASLQYPRWVKASGPTVCLDPCLAAFYVNETQVGMRFNATIWLKDVTVDVGGAQVTVFYDDNLINVTRCFVPTWDPEFFMPSNYYVLGTAYHPHGYYPARFTVAVVHTLPFLPPWGHDGIICVLEFSILRVPSPGDEWAVTLSIDNEDTFVMDTSWLIDGLVKEDGTYSIINRVPIFHDVAVTGLDVSKKVVDQSETVCIDVSVANFGEFPERIKVTVYADADTSKLCDEASIGSKTRLVYATSSNVLSFAWNTSTGLLGNQTISAKADVVPQETDVTNNFFKGCSVTVLPVFHDLAVTDVRLSDEVAYVDDMVSVEVDVQNQCRFKDTANVTVYADDKIGNEVTIGTTTIQLEKGSTATATFNWITSGLPGGNYTFTTIVSKSQGEVDIADNRLTKGLLRLFQPKPCPDITITCPTTLTINPSIFSYNSTLKARLINIGNLLVKSTGFEGQLRVVGYRNGTIRLCVNQAGTSAHMFNLPLNGQVQIPLWVVFQPETHWGYYNDGTYNFKLKICGTYTMQLTIRGIDIDVCQNGAYTVRGSTAKFTWELTGGSLVYLEAETSLPPGWTYVVDPPIGTLFETPRAIKVNITAPPDAKEGDIGRVTLRAYKNSTGSMIWQFLYYVCTDNKPPTIESVETPMFTPDGNLVFNATVRDFSGIAKVVLYYSVNGGPWKNITMEWANGDTFNSTQYTANGFFGTTPQTVRYYFSATNWLGNQTTTVVRTVNILNDVIVSSVYCDRTFVRPLEIVKLNATVLNNGTLPLSLVNVAVYVNSTLVTTLPVFNLLNGTSRTLQVLIDTRAFQNTSSYVITAFAACIPDEASRENNAKHSEGFLAIALPGDINLDTKVDLRDVFRVGKAYGSFPGMPNWDPPCDVSRDDKVDLKDYYATCRNYGKCYPKT